MRDQCLSGISRVALLAEGVDRNTQEVYEACRARVSPSSRRAWIEIQVGKSELELNIVALLAEGVDRNSFVMSTVAFGLSRPPRGGRG